MLDLIKKAAKDAVQASNPVSVFYGTITKASPLEVNVDQRFTLTADFLIMTERLTRYTVTVGNQTIVIREGLKTGDRVLLLRIQGGQKYVLHDKVVS